MAVLNAASQALAALPAPAPQPAAPAAAAPIPGPPQPEPPSPAPVRAIFSALAAPPPGEAHPLLALLRQAKAEEKVSVYRFEALPPICVVPTIGAFYSRASLHEISARLQASRSPPAVATAATAFLGRSDADKDYASVRARPLGHLLWVAALHGAGPAEVERYGHGAHHLRAWPDLATLPHQGRHVSWCGALARRPATLAALAAGASPLPAAAFLAACDELGLLTPGEDAPAPPAPPADSAVRQERATIFRSVLSRLGFARP